LAHDVFISYAKKDAAVADAVCADLEANGIQCWIAPRNIVSGTKYSQAIINGITQSQLMVLIYSAGANESNHVVAEIDRAYNKRIPIIPFRIEDVPLSTDLEYYLSTSQWLDAQDGPLQKHLPHLVETVRLLLKKTDSLPALPSPRPVPPVTKPRSKLPWIIAGAGALLAVALAAVLVIGLVVVAIKNSSSKTPDNHAPPDNGPVAPRSSPEPSQGGRVAAVETELLRRARKAILDAEVSGDKKALDGLLRQDFKTRRPDDQILTKEQVMGELDSGQMIEGLKVPDRSKVTIAVDSASSIGDLGLMSLVKITYEAEGRTVTEVRRDITVFAKEGDHFVATVNRWSKE
jgi:hypothetical protein